MSKRPVALLYDEYIRALETLAAQYRHAFTETWMKAIVNAPVNRLIPGSMTLLRAPSRKGI